MSVNREVTGANARGLGWKLLQRGKQAKAIVEIGVAIATPIGGGAQSPGQQVAAQAKELKDYQGGPPPGHPSGDLQDPAHRDPHAGRRHHRDHSQGSPWPSLTQPKPGAIGTNEDDQAPTEEGLTAYRGRRRQRRRTGQPGADPPACLGHC